MASNESVSDDAEPPTSLQEMADAIDALTNRVDELEQRNELLQRQLESAREVIDEDGLTAAEGVVAEHGGIVPMLESLDPGGANTSVSDEVRQEMLPAHRIWIDVRDGADDTLGKSNRRAAVLFGAFIRKAAGKSPSEDSVLGYNGVDASGQKYTLSSTEAKRTLEECAYLNDDKVYSQTVKRAFEDVQGSTKTDDCDCANIEACGHGLVIFDGSGGTNRLVTNKARFNNAMTHVVEAVEAAANGGQSVDTADDSVTPEPGADEAAGGRADVKAELNELTTTSHVEGDDD